MKLKSSMAFFGFLIIGVLVFWAAGPSSAQEVLPGGNHAVDLSQWDSKVWHRSDGYSNGGSFNVGFRADHAKTLSKNLNLTIDNQPCPDGCSAKPYAAGEMETTNTFGYGTYTVTMKTSNAVGTVSTFFTYIDPGTNGLIKNDEIDVEIPGERPRTLEATYYKAGGAGVSHVIELPFDSSQDFHTYSIRWLPNTISWIVDKKVLYIAHGTPFNMPTVPSKLLLNFWTGTSALDGWLGAFKYKSPVTAVYKSASFIPDSMVK